MKKLKMEQLTLLVFTLSPPGYSANSFLKWMGHFTLLSFVLLLYLVTFYTLCLFEKIPVQSKRTYIILDINKSKEAPKWVLIYDVIILDELYYELHSGQKIKSIFFLYILLLLLLLLFTIQQIEIILIFLL